MKDRISEAWTINQPHLNDPSSSRASPTQHPRKGLCQNLWNILHGRHGIGFSHQGYVNAEAHHGGETCHLDLLDAYSADGEDESSVFVGCGLFWGDVAGRFGNELGRTHRFF